MEPEEAFKGKKGTTVTTHVSETRERKQRKTEPFSGYIRRQPKLLHGCPLRCWPVTVVFPEGILKVFKILNSQRKVPTVCFDRSEKTMARFGRKSKYRG